MSKNGDSSAHSVVCAPNCRSVSPGLSKREYFAVRLHSGIIASGKMAGIDAEDLPRLTALAAVNFADELLKALEK